MSNSSFEQRTGRTAYYRQLQKELEALLNPDTGMLDERFSEIVLCPLCSKGQYKQLFDKKGFTFVQCTHCGLIYTNPMVRSELVLDAYSKSKANELWIDVLLNEENQKWQQSYFQDILSMLEKHVTKGRLLDIGCSIGLFMERATENGWDAVGLELGNKAYQICREKELRVFQKTVEACDFSEPFQLVTAFGLLEHLNDPISFLQETKKLISEDGIVSAIVPNVYGLANMIIREKATTFDGRNHLLYFSTRTLRMLFETCRYEILSMDTITAALDNIEKTIQYHEPYQHNQKSQFLPEKLANFFQNENRQNLEEWILQNDLGFHIRIIARPIK